jgi:hypothetical protein
MVVYLISSIQNVPNWSICSCPTSWSSCTWWQSWWKPNRPWHVRRPHGLTPPNSYPGLGGPGGQPEGGQLLGGLTLLPALALGPASWSGWPLWPKMMIRIMTRVYYDKLSCPSKLGCFMLFLLPYSLHASTSSQLLRC